MVLVIRSSYELVFVAFCVTCVTAPTFGAILSGLIGSYIGGYASKYALPILCSCGILASFFGPLIPFYDKFWPIVINLWIYLFFGGIMLPMITGVLLTSV
jgi:hypothetical protein